MTYAFVITMWPLWLKIQYIFFKKQGNKVFAKGLNFLYIIYSILTLFALFILGSVNLVFLDFLDKLSFSSKERVYYARAYKA